MLSGRRMKKTSRVIQLVSWSCARVFSLFSSLLSHPLTPFLYFSRLGGRVDPREDSVYQHLFFFLFFWVGGGTSTPAASFFLASVWVLLQRNSLTLLLSCSSVFSAANQAVGVGASPSLPCFRMRSVSLSSFINPTHRGGSGHTGLQTRREEMPSLRPRADSKPKSGLIGDKLREAEECRRGRMEGIVGVSQQIRVLSDPSRSARSAFFFLFCFFSTKENAPRSNLHNISVRKFAARPTCFISLIVKGRELTGRDGCRDLAGFF